MLDLSNYKVLQVQGMALIEGSGIEGLKKSLILSSSKRELDLPLYETVTGFKNRLKIPRALVQDQFKPIRGSWEDITFKSRVTLRPEQEAMIERFESSCKSLTPYGGIIKSSTGSGKTVMALEIMRRIGLKTLIIVPLDSLVKQWFERITQHTDIKGEDIGVIQGPIRMVEGKKVVIAMIHTLAQQEIPKYIKDAFGLVVIDEVHVLGAETFSRTAPMFNCKIRLGLSATPRRKDDMENVFLYHIGPVVSEYKKQMTTPKILRIGYNNADTNHSGCVWGGELNLGKYLNRLADSVPRLEIIVKAISQAYAKNRQPLILTDRLKMVEDIKRLLISIGVIKEDIGVLTSKIKQLDCTITIATYGSAGMGVDIPRLDTIILATPRVDVEQAVGRVLRKVDGKKQPVVIDIVDEASSIMQGWYMARCKFYKKINAEIITY